MKNTILVDIGIIVEYLKTGKGVLPLAYEKYKMKITTTTYAELLTSSTFKDEVLEKEVIDFLKKYFDLIDVNEKIAIEIAKVLRASGDVTLATAINAAAAKAEGLKVLTEDRKAYDKVDELEFLEI